MIYGTILIKLCPFYYRVSRSIRRVRKKGEREGSREGGRQTAAGGGGGVKVKREAENEVRRKGNRQAGRISKDLITSSVMQFLEEMLNLFKF